MPVIYPGAPIGSSSWSTGDLPEVAASNSTSWTTLDINRDDETGSFSAADSNICTYTKQHNSSHLLISWWIPLYIGNGGSGNGFRLHISKDNSTYYTDAIDNGPADGWGAHGYGGNASGVWCFTWDTKIIDTYRTSGFEAHTGTVYFYWQWRNWGASDTTYPITYSTSYNKYGTIELLEYAV
jgi:hypothetical protein